MTKEFTCNEKHSRNFGIALQVIAEVKRNCGTISMASTQHLSQQQKILLDKNSLQLWLHTLRGWGYIKKTNPLPNGNRYSLTSKGENELRYHLSVD
jgi:hypothetical protein